MIQDVRKAAVLGAGTMGSRIAAHLANAGVDCLLLDIPAPGADSRAGRNAVVEKALKALPKSKPPALFTQGTIKRLKVGNFEDDLERVAGADWVIEAVIENFDIKRNLLKKLDEVRRPGTLVSSNTSGLPIGKLAEGLSSDFRKHWMGTHFFNPPRHMRLVELIPTPDTNQKVVDFVSRFCDRRLGKVVVFANDRPNFIANRIFLFSVMHTLKTMREQGLSIEEVDALTGQLIGRPRMATFRLADFTGVDVCLYVAETLYKLVPDDEQREVYNPPEFLKEMVAHKMLGDKTGQGFYKKVGGPRGRDRLVLDIPTMQYREPRPGYWPSLEHAGEIGDTGERIKFMIAQKDGAGRFLWETMSELFLYAAARIPEVTGDIVSVDRTMKAGFNWKLGIFEIWNSIGAADSAARMEKDGKSLPPLVQKVLASGEKTFYGEAKGVATYFDFESAKQKALEDPPGVLRLDAAKRKSGPIQSNAGASLWDLGDGIVCLEFHSKANTLDRNVLAMIEQSIDEAEANFEGLVIGNDGENFSVGANLMMILELSRGGDFDQITKAIERFQNAFRRLRNCTVPTVAAVFGQTLAGGCEISLRCDHVQAAAETYMGLVEVGAGLVPAAGGCAEMLRRHTADTDPESDLNPPSRAVFEKIGMAKVATSAAEALEWKYLRPTDAITMNRDRLLADAKRAAIDLAEAGYHPPAETEILVGGAGVHAAFELGLYMLREGGYASDYDVHVGRKLAGVLSGGKLSQPSYVSEDYLLRLEREAFVSLCGEEKTQQRIESLLKTGKPLRN